jgi:hypothetical protein
MAWRAARCGWPSCWSDCPGSLMSAWAWSRARPRAALLGVRLAEALGVRERSDVYYVTLPQHIGCTAYAHEAAALLGGDELAVKAAAIRTDFGSVSDVVLGYLPRLAPGSGGWTRLRVAVTAAAHARQIVAGYSRVPPAPADGQRRRRAEPVPLPRPRPLQGQPRPGPPPAPAHRGHPVCLTGTVAGQEPRPGLPSRGSSTVIWCRSARISTFLSRSLISSSRSNANTFVTAR